MKKNLRLWLYAGLSCLSVLVMFRSNTLLAQGAAPSQHLTFSFPSDAVLKMHKVKIVQTAFTEYFEVHSFTGGYAGLQHTPDSSKGSSHVLISSLWDPNTSAGIYSSVAYQAPNTFTGRFGGEGDGYKSINPYNWVMNRWYNLVIRSWKSGGKLYIATFINDMSTNAWFHTATLAMPAPANNLGSGNDAFLENWDSNVNWNGAFVRKAFFKDCWNLNTAGVWQKHTSRYFSANAGDSARNGIYDRAFDAGYDAVEDAYYMVHGGSTTPGAGFGTGRTLTLPVQTNQGTAPAITAGIISTVSAGYANGTTTISWTNNNTTGPQLSAKVEILNAGGTVLATQQDTIPQKRNTTFAGTLPAGSYTARVAITDIFNNVSTPVTTTFTVTGGTDSTFYKFKNVYSNLYLGIKDSSTANSATLVQYANSNGYHLQWYLSTQSNGAVVMINRRSGKAIDLPGSAQTLGTHPIQYVVTNNTNQQWNLVATTAGAYLIQSNMSNHYVLDDSASSTLSGTGIILYSQSGTSGSANQQWLRETSSGTLSMLSAPAVMAAVAPAVENKATANFQVYPNPAGNMITITRKQASGKAWFFIYDVNGREMKRVYSTSANTQVDISLLHSGTYFVKFGKESAGFVKE